MHNNKKRIIFCMTLLLLLISISFFTLCIENKKINQRNYRYAITNDLELKIELLNIEKNNTWEFKNGLKTRLFNINSTPIKIEKNLIFGSNLKGFIITPDNTTHPIVYTTAIYYKKEECILEPKKYIEDTRTFWNRAYCHYDFNINGTHLIQLYYTGVNPYVYSNIVSFNIKLSE